MPAGAERLVHQPSAGPFADGPARIDREVDTVPAISLGRQRPRNRTAFTTAMFLRRIEREHVAAMYRWTHPHNVAWASTRGTARDSVQGLSLEAQR